MNELRIKVDRLAQRGLTIVLVGMLVFSAIVLAWQAIKADELDEREAELRKLHKMATPEAS